MGIQLKGGGDSRNRNRFAGQPEFQETAEMKAAREKREAEAKAALAQKQEEMRMRALAFEKRDAARREREELKNNPELAAERQRKIAELKAEEDRLAQMKAEEEAKIEAERRVQEKKMDQTEALIAAIRAQVEKEKAAKAAANQKQDTAKTSASKSATSGNAKPQFRTISPEEMQKLEERKRMKAAGIQPEEKPKSAESKTDTGGGLAGGVSGGLGGLGNGPTLSNPTSGQESLTNMGMDGSGLGIEITASEKKSDADESTVALDINAINSAANETSKAHNPVPEPVQVVGDSSTVVVDGENAWNTGEENADASEEVSWVDSGAKVQTIKNESRMEKATDENGDIVSVVPVRQRPGDSNDVQSAYNIDFDDDDDDDFININSASDNKEEEKRKAEEEARKAAEEAARKAAEEEARRKAEEEARKAAEEAARKAAEEEARRKAEEEARKAAEEAARKAAEEEARRKAEEEARRAEEEALKYKQMAEEAARKAAEAEKALKAAQNQAEPQPVAAAQTTAYSLPVGAEQFLGKYLTVNSISDQIVQAIKYISENPTSPRNVVILGQYGFGTTTIAEDFARSFHAMGICKNKTIAKIKGGALNRANISDAISKLQGGCLVVENAGVISNEKLDEIYQIVNNPNNDVVVILTGQIETVSRIFKDNAVISSQFKHLIQVHRITDLDVLAIAKNHAKDLGYPCEAAAENNLRKRMQEVESGNLDRVLKIVDNAVSKAHNREMSTGEQDHHLVPGDFE